MVHIHQDLRHQIRAIVLREERGINQCFRPRGNRLSGLAAHGIGKTGLRHRAKSGFRVHRIAQLVALNDLHRLGHEIVKQALHYIDPLDPTATLPGIEHRAINQRFDRRIEIRVLHHIAGVLAAKLQPEPGKGPLSGGFHRLPAANRSGEIDKPECTIRDQRRCGLVIKEHVLEHAVRHARIIKCLGQPLAHQRRLAGMFEYHRIASDQRGRDRVDRRHIGVIPRGHDQHQPVRHPLDHAAKITAVLDGDFGQCLFGDVGHMLCALVKAAKFAAIADRTAHLPSQFRHDLIIHRADVFDALHHKRSAFGQGPRGP
nr:hypothetical protein [Roseobacter litoralis]